MSLEPAMAPRPMPPAPGEAEALLGALHRNRRTFAWKTGGLTAEQLGRTLAPSTLTLAGLVKHLALVEDHYFTHQLLGEDYPGVWAPMAAEADWEWNSAVHDTPEELRALWLAAVERSERAVETVLREHDLDHRVAQPDGHEPFSLRRVLVDMIEEYARHTGHADLLRESIDGLTGEDAPPHASA
ncbi:DinB family protein [Nocardioides litoris]|uniref:DinB family protein n=1 Tax=Nocardioides litoris TaxID=1926648 RepID=UPI0011225CE8|nr:DinB family protein [Nocardioides litoris]